MAVSVTLPKFNLEKSSGEISAWLVSAGDEVKEGQTLFEVEDDKAAVEVDATASGFIGNLAPEGEEIDVGAVVAEIFESKKQALAAKAAPDTPDTPAEIAPIAVSPAPDTPVASIAPDSKIRSTPLARRMARDSGLDIEGLVGSGPRGRVQKRDVEAAKADSGLLVPVGIEPVQPAPPSQPQSPISSYSGETLHHVWFKQGQGIPVVFLHGFSGESVSWNMMLSGAHHAFPALGVDLPGHGNSPLGVPSNLDDVAEAVEATLAGLGIRQAFLCGHSFGGGVAARIAARGNVMVAGQVLFAPAGLSPTVNGSFIGGMARASTKESLTPWLKQLVQDTSLISEAFVGRTLAGRSPDKLAALQGFADRFFADSTQCFSIIDNLAATPGPLRVVFGRQDQVLPADATRSLPGNVALQLWDQCGHMPHIEHRAMALNVLQEVYRSAC